MQEKVENGVFYIAIKNQKMPKHNLNRIKAVLAERNVTNRELANELGKAETTVSRWCTNDMQPSVETLYEIAKVLDVDIRELLVSTK